MANIEHNVITDPNIHEPKGASTASVNTVYVSDGAGSGTWKKPDTAAINYADVLASIQADIDDSDLNLNAKYWVYAKFADVSTAETILVPVLANAVFKKATLVLGGAITVADSLVSFKNAAGASMGTDVTVAFTGSAKGTTFSFTATGNNTLTAPTYIDIATDGGSTTAQPLFMLLEFTATLN